MRDRRGGAGRMERRGPAIAGAVVALLALAGTAPSRAQGAPAERVEFDAAIRLALERNPTVAEAATAVRQAEALLRRARAVNLPNLSVDAARTLRDEEISFDGIEVQPRTQSVISARASVPVLAAADWAAAAQSRDRVRIAQLAAEETRQRIAISTAQAYLSVIAARRQVEVERDALDNARAHLDYAQTRLSGGAGSRLDRVRAALQVSAQELLLERSGLALFDSQAALGVLLAADGPVDAGAEPDFDVPGAGEPPSWRADRPDLRLRAAELEAAVRADSDSWKDWVPDLTLAFTPQWLVPAGAFQQSSTWQLSLLFSESLFDAGARGSRAAEREVARDRARLQLSASEIRARAEVLVARESLESHRRALASARRAAAQAQEALRITSAAFELGSTTNLEVIDAERSARDAATAAAVVEDDVRRAALDLLIALGRFPE